MGNQGIPVNDVNMRFTMGYDCLAVRNATILQETLFPLPEWAEPDALLSHLRNDKSNEKGDLVVRSSRTVAADFLQDPANSTESSFVHDEGGEIMRYALAMFCPPLALLISHRPYQASIVGVLFTLAIATAGFYGIGAILDFFLILWATNAVGDDLAGREARAFIQTVKPIPVIHD